jgi:predicted dienelactone hydrolase
LSTNISQQLAALAAMQELGRTPSSIFSGHVDDSASGIVGHSAGGETAVATAAADPMIRVVVSLAGVPSAPPKRSLPMLFMTGSSDHVVPSSGIETFYRQVLAPKGLLVIDGAGHNVFDDICTIARSEGGLGGAAKLLHLPVPASVLALAADGCKPPDIYPPIAWPLINQATVAELRYGFGIDSSPVGLGPGLDHAFDGVTGIYSSAP